MPGPRSMPDAENGRPRYTKAPECAPDFAKGHYTGKTEKDHASGKWARRVRRRLEPWPDGLTPSAMQIATGNLPTKTVGGKGRK